MIGKIMQRAAFKGCVCYVMNKQDAKMIAADGVLLSNMDSIIRSFNTQRLMKPNIKHPVGHISLSYLPDDTERLTNGAMVTLAKEYMQEMNITDTQYIIVRHYDNGNPHVHIVYNRINNNGKVISDKNDRYRNEAVCKKIKNKYGLSYGKGKGKVKQHKLRGKDKTKYQVYNAVKDALSKSTDWNDFEKLLKGKGVALSYKYKGQTNEVQGISFTIGDVTFKGSEIDRNFSYLKLDKQLKNNAQNHIQSKTTRQSFAKESNSQSQGAGIVGSLIEGLDSMSIFQTHGEDPQEERFQHEMERKQKQINRKNGKRPRFN
ncbi:MULTISPECIES: relaxase/mobilization nuclease domain-containing protein [Dysgonomonas]|uniref:relaxase/mobilization nuclease domain-containing protein n=1 Tax=Dysgonomonas TaxID=156973 RepID=UPI000926A139|nr:MULTISPECIES: relaxase/mobilization nuclease domain-containing protein [Dysgonomonas]MBN9300415.1 relaxase/mobilization nuclease domain-containing protein [Dysgonomonas mossii]OJX60600.1 MAG: mobilization protein [Dysgonomonas sp. 37-18]